MKKYLFLPPLILLTLFLSSCGNKAPTEKQLKEMVPLEALEYYFDDEYCISDIADLEIIRQSTNDTFDEADCKIILEDTNATRTAYITMYTRYWNKGGWMLSSWEFYDDEEISPLTTFDTNRFIELIADRGYTDIKEESVVKASKYIKCQYSVDEKHLYADIYGNIIAEASLVRDLSAMNQISYNWDIIIDFSDIDAQWDVVGSWYGETYSYENSPDNAYRVTFDILSFSPDGTFTYSAKTTWDSTRGGEGSYIATHDDGSTFFENNWSLSGNVDEPWTIKLPIYSGYPSYTVKISLDSAVFRTYHGVFGDELPYTSVKKIT